ncbi:hypothetical protein CASFOL_023745 [Castilleja foliolosa]|uniref:S-acyltransferase n=1 Tax=Castilleja foliolosa TaxID=1961234 RepID=A0ABD3CPC2_9LAMI
MDNNTSNEQATRDILKNFLVKYGKVPDAEKDRRRLGMSNKEAAIGVVNDYELPLRTGIETAGDSTQMGVRVEMVGTQFGVGPRGVPMPANIRVSYSTSRRVYVEGVTSNCIRKSSENRFVPLRNYRYFFCFVSLAALLCIYVFAISAFYIKVLMDDYQGTVWRAMKESPASVVLMAYCFISLWFVGGLTGFHLYLISTNQTTYENFRYRSDNRINVYHRGCLNNFLEVFCTKVQPSKNDFRAFVTDEQPQRPPMHTPRDADLEDNNNNTGDNRRMKVEDDMDIGGDHLKISQRHIIEDIEADICSCTCQLCGVQYKRHNSQ